MLIAELSTKLQITIKYYFPIPRLEDMIDKLQGFEVFCKVGTRSGYHHICIRNRDDGRLLLRLEMTYMNGQ